MIGGLEITNYKLFERLKEDLRLEENGWMQEIVTKTVVPVVDIIDRQWSNLQFAFTAKAIYGEILDNLVVYYTVPADEEWEIILLYKPATAGAVYLGITNEATPIINFMQLANDSTGQSLWSGSVLKPIRLRAPWKLGLSESNAAGDTNIALKILYRTRKI